ncbi:MAG: hypothetical protein EOP83_34530 [Verrucomicrobiaceae bacterium]|nr:MAG: hypothetical protein EOP83_34530 [Verrucomicrobiaceae bacterium]
MEEYRFTQDVEVYTFPAVFVIRGERDGLLLDIQRWDAVINWCIDQYGGPERNRWTYSVSGKEILFRSDADASVFKMRWC